LLSACGKVGFAGAALLSPELGAGLSTDFSVPGALRSSALPQEVRQSLGGAVVTAGGVLTVLTGLDGIVIGAGFVSSKRFADVEETTDGMLPAGPFRTLVLPVTGAVGA
jgi:hypothetical protein